MGGRNPDAWICGICHFLCKCFLQGQFQTTSVTSLNINWEEMPPNFQLLQAGRSQLQHFPVYIQL